MKIPAEIAIHVDEMLFCLRLAEQKCANLVDLEKILMLKNVHSDSKICVDTAETEPSEKMLIW